MLAMSSPTLDELFASPDHYLHSFDGDDVIFVPMDRAAYQRSIFLDGRISPAANQSMRRSVKTLAPLPRGSARTGWIFHIAHCGSTLLARALDQRDSNLVLREPLALRQSALGRDAARLELIRRMLSKRYMPDAPTIAKANVPVNFILPELAAITPDDPAVLLYCSLTDYLLAILRSDDHRIWLRRVTGQLAASLGDLSSLPDAELAAALWLAQMKAFSRATNDLAGARALDAELFFAHPEEVLKAAARHLNVAITDRSIAATVASPMFSTYSKNPAVPFDNAARVARRTALAASLAGEVEQAKRWIERTAGKPEEATAALERVALL